MLKVRLILRVAICIVLTTTCANESSDSGTAQYVVTKNTGDGVWTDRTRWSITEDLSIGSDEGNSPDVFGAIVDISLDQANRLYILDNLERKVSVFDEDGRFVRSLGRAGRGPGEFVGPTGVFALPSGQIGVLDAGAGLILIFDSTGRYSSSVLRATFGTQLPWKGGSSASGAIFDGAMGADGKTERLTRITRTPRQVDTFSLPPFERLRFTVHRGGRSSSVGVPFAPSQHWSLDLSRERIWVGVTDSFRFAETTLSGDTIRVITLDRAPVKISRRDMDAELEYLADFVRQGGTVDRALIPRDKPMFRSIDIDPTGNVWVSSLDRDVPEFSVFDRSGIYLGNLQTPAAASEIPVVLSDSFVYSVLSDTLGRPFVKRFRIARGSPL